MAAKRGRPKTTHTQIPLRLTSEQVAAVEAYADKVRRETGFAVSRADVLRRVIDAGLAALAVPEKKR